MAIVHTARHPVRPRGRDRSSAAAQILDGLDEASEWDALLSAEPGLSRRVSRRRAGQVLEAMADLVDIKWPYLAGHSRGVANLVAAAGAGQRAAADETSRRCGAPGWSTTSAGSASPTRIWDRPGPLNEAESERVRLHPYLTDRMLARVSCARPQPRDRGPAPRAAGRLGLPARADRRALTPPDRLLAAADAYHAMTEPRPYRPPRSAPGGAPNPGRGRAGRLDGDSVNAVLPPPVSGRRPGGNGRAGSPRREVEVLALVARGQSNKEIARRLGVATRQRPTMSSTSTPSSAYPAGRPRPYSPPSTVWWARSSPPS